MKSKNEKIAKNEYWLDAFLDEFLVLWHETKFQREVPHVCHVRAATCFWGKEDQDIYDRRKLLYHFMSRVFATDLTDDTLNKWFSILPASSSMLRRAIKNLCVAYNYAPTRHFRRDVNLVSDNEKEILSRLYTKGRINTVMQSAYRQAKLLNTVLIHVGQDSGTPVLTVYPPDLCRVLPKKHNIHEIQEVWIPTMYDDGLQYKVWIAGNEEVKAQYKLFNPRTKSYTEEVELDYDRLPFVTLRLDANTTDFWGGGEFELVEAQLRLNKLDVTIDENVDYNAIGIWIGTNLKVDVNNFRLSPGKAILTEGVVNMEGAELPPLLEHVNAQTHFNELGEFRSRKEREALQSQGLPSSAVNKESAANMSGVAMMIDNKELSEMREEDINVLLTVEQDLLECLIAVMNADAMLGFNPEKLTVSVNYQEQRVFLEPRDEYELLKQQFADGLISAVEYVRRTTGDESIATDEEAMQLIRKNKAIITGAKDENAQSLASALNSLSPLIATKVLEKLSDDEIRSIVGMQPKTEDTNNASTDTQHSSNGLNESGEQPPAQQSEGTGNAGVDSQAGIGNQGLEGNNAANAGNA